MLPKGMDISKMYKVEVMDRHGDAYTTISPDITTELGKIIEYYPVWFENSPYDYFEHIPSKKIKYVENIITKGKTLGPDLKDMYKVSVTMPSGETATGFTPSIIPFGNGDYPIWYGKHVHPDNVSRHRVKFLIDPSLTIEQHNRLECKKYCEMLNAGNAKAYALVGEISPDYAMICSDPTIPALVIANKLEIMAKILRLGHAQAINNNNKTNIA